MPPVEEAPAARLTLADMGGPGAPPDDYVMPPSKGGEGTPPKGDAPAKGPVPEPPIAPLVDEETPTDVLPDPDPSPTPPKKNDDEPEPTLADSMDDPVEVAKREEAEKKAAEQKKKDEETAAAKAKETGAPAQNRDDDLRHEAGAHVHPKTRKVITEFQAKAKAARDERDAAIAEREALKKERDELAEKAKVAPPSKELETEVATLRERVRELDINQDPALQAKYDRKMETNNKTIIDVLKGQGFGTAVRKKENGESETVENPAAIAKLVKDGLTLNNLQPYIKKLEEAGLVEEAAEIREAITENKRLARSKAEEIQSWKGDYTKRQQEREAATKQQQEQQNRRFIEQTDAQLKPELAELEKTFPHLKRPADILATDTPATQKAKQAVIDEWTASRGAVEKAVQSLKVDGVPPEKIPEVVGRINASAIQAFVYKHQVLPRLMRDLAALTARSKELETELAQIKDAGKLSRLHSSSTTDPNQRGAPEAKSLEEAFVSPS